VVTAGWSKSYERRCITFGRFFGTFNDLCVALEAILSAVFAARCLLANQELLCSHLPDLPLLPTDPRPDTKEVDRTGVFDLP